MSHSYSFADFLAAHQQQLEAGGIPPELWGQLHKKLLQETFDAGESFRIVCEEEGDVKHWSVLATTDLHPVDEDCVFLIDHAWTFRPHQAREQLENMPELVERMKGIMDITDKEAGQDAMDSEDEITTTEELENKEIAEEEERAQTEAGGDARAGMMRNESIDARLGWTAKKEDTVIDQILKKMWKYVNTYTVRFKTEFDEESMPLWYVMDEFGSRIGHSDHANARVVPLFYAPHGVAYNVLFLTKELKEDDEVLRDYADHALSKQHPDWRRYFLLPWQDGDFSSGSLEREPLQDAFFQSGRSVDKLPSESAQNVSSKRKDDGKVRIFADDTQLVKHLKAVDYELVNDWKDADVVWMRRHFHEFSDLCDDNPGCLVNQFPYECCLTVKDLLSAILSHEEGGKGPEWFQTCFNLNCELPQFVAYFQQREARNEDNTWIVKPWNLARGLDMHVSNDIGHMVRLTESGPKIACKYISRPVLFPRPDSGYRVKFDLRFIVFVRHVAPVEAYVYNKFWIRFAINDFSLDQLDDNETHFTVFNYSDKSKILQMECAEFISQIEKTYNTVVRWSEVQQEINKVLKGTLEAASKRSAPQGMAPNKQSRAMYGADIMLQWKGEGENRVQPTLLEYNFMPDCQRACEYYPDFADTVFNTLFLDKIDTSKVTKL